MNPLEMAHGKGNLDHVELLLLVCISEQEAEPILTTFSQEFGKGVANPLVKRLLFGLHKASVATKN